MSTQLGAIPYIIGICPCGLLNFVENLTKLGVSVRKIQAVNLFNTLNCYINYMVRFMWMLFLKFTCTNYKENMATDRFTTSTFRAVDYAKPAQFVLHGVLYRA